MRLKAMIEDCKALHSLLHVCRSIQRCCLIGFQASRMRFFTSTEVSEGIQVWISTSTSHIFSDFRCESSYAENGITCDVLDPQQFYHIIKQVDGRDRQRSQYPPMIRLVSVRGHPMLRISVQEGEGQPDVSYDVPIRILSAEEMLSISSPTMEEHYLRVLLPSLLELSTFVEKLNGTACECVSFEARVAAPLMHGEGPRTASLRIEARHYLAAFTLTYDSLALVPRQKTSDGADDEDEDDGLTLSTVTVEVKKVARFLAAVKDLANTGVHAFLVDGVALVLTIAGSGNTNVVAYIPAKNVLS